MVAGEKPPSEQSSLSSPSRCTSMISGSRNRLSKSPLLSLLPLLVQQLSLLSFLLLLLLIVEPVSGACPTIFYAQAITHRRLAEATERNHRHRLRFHATRTGVASAADCASVCGDARDVESDDDDGAAAEPQHHAAPPRRRHRPRRASSTPSIAGDSGSHKCRSAVYNHDAHTCALSRNDARLLVGECRAQRQRYNTFHLARDGEEAGGALSVLACIDACNNNNNNTSGVAAFNAKRPRWQQEEVTPARRTQEEELERRRLLLRLSRRKFADDGQQQGVSSSSVAPRHWMLDDDDSTTRERRRKSGRIFKQSKSG